MVEVWKDIDGYGGVYQVSSFARIRSFTKISKGKIMKQTLSRDNGYFVVDLYKDGINKQFTVHSLVASAFVPNPNNLETVNHKDEKKTNNLPSNLEWMSRGNNASYSNTGIPFSDERRQKISEGVLKNWDKRKGLI